MTVTVLAAADGLLVAGDADGSIRVWRVGSVDAAAAAAGGGGGGVTWEQEVVLTRAHEKSVRALSIRHGRLLSGGDDGVVTVWNYNQRCVGSVGTGGGGRGRVALCLELLAPEVRVLNSASRFNESVR